MNRFGTRGAFVVQLWHGIPLKRLHLDSPATMRVSFLPDHRLVRGLVARAYRVAGRGISLFPVASELVAARVASAFGVPRERIAVTGDPRTDALLTPASDALAAIEAATGAPLGAARVVLFAPTWRDGAPDPGVPGPAEWDAIAAWLERTDAMLLIRSHPLGVGDYAAGPARSERIRLLGTDRVRDVNTVLSAVDAVLTDYSSIAFDAALIGVPSVLLAADLESYAKGRGLYDPYREFSGGRHVAGWTEALDLLDAALAGDAAARAVTERLRREYFDLPAGGATTRVLDEVLARVDGRAPAPHPVQPRPPARALTLRGDPPRLALRLPGGVDTASLDGARARVGADLRVDADGAVATFPLLVERWGAPGLALPSGDYRLVLGRGVGATARVDADLDGVGELRHPLFRAKLVADAGGLVLRVAPPLDDDELGGAAQQRLERGYRRSRPEPEDAVFLESFYGQTAADNPAGIDRALARLRPETRRYWSVVDGSIEVPEGGIRLIEGSREWWRVRGSARAIIVNDWLRKRYRRRSHQKVLQTWHGTMLKRLGLDRPNVGMRTRIAVQRERDRWDVLLAQNEYSARIFRSAYAMRAPIWEEGYPRNDVLVHDGMVAAEVRRRVGIPEGRTVVLYAPTWRDDRTEMVDYVDLAALAAALGDNHVLLVRGHSRTLRYGHDLEGRGLVDVTTYPSMADLLLVTDVLVTDYSSVMFDFSSTGRPIVFFTPDLQHYSADLRGFYFDLLAEAPGPVVSTRDELLAAIRSAPEDAGRYAERAARWRERFTPHDDGASGDRVVRRMIADGWFD